MEWTTIITSLIAAILSGGGIGALFYRKENKRMKEAEIEAKEVENDRKAADEWQAVAEGKQKRIDHLEATVAKKDEKIEELYATIGDLRERVDNLSTENAVLKIYKCVKIECGDRQPPFGTAYAPAKFEYDTATLIK